MKNFDVLIIGGGAAGMSCALILGSAKEKEFAKDKKIGIVLHQKSSHLQDALFNNVLGLAAGTTGRSILEQGKNQLATLYPHVNQIEGEKVLEVKHLEGGFKVVTNRFEYQSKLIVIAVGYTNTFFIKGLEQYVITHKKSKPEKNRIQLKNKDHLVSKGIYVAGSLAGWRSQFAIACGSGASVATDILTEWNGGEHTKVHDKIIPSL
ncbi:NAD(P)/FAD-dependent oxidoreductase [Aureibaculum marinum]|uniref:NAD(P)/FAD-dependent oxidoreductase n=1 Tax=Aureibaculum marinum TaxID=2487930 RepID=A0A3N4PAT6_9FLAO|nr:FAD-dependent oxidoreductase [Aureibaculum marinum]RPD96633.1 NAD(P)/FAD-dependent oxidoreductase [Aureibaculum marinum]